MCVCLCMCKHAHCISIHTYLYYMKYLSRKLRSHVKINKTYGKKRIEEMTQGIFVSNFVSALLFSLDKHHHDQHYLGIYIQW